ncbi:MAG TPA: hypothetical protein VHY19_06065 [Steroidobacteraceae bacterium]|jgi:hypothetical protein|nr:hypothetical protein [Steroidobacteraceae bacterium]
MLPSIDRRAFISSLGGAAAVVAMTHEARADALEHALAAPLQKNELHAEPESMKNAPPPTVAELEAQIPTRTYRRGVGSVFVGAKGEKVARLQPLPAAPKLLDYFELRFTESSQHCLQSANKAKESGADEEIILACLLHDTVQTLIRADHGWWGAQMYGPYVPERTAWAIRYHQALRFYPDKEAGYEYPDLYRHLYGVDYVPPPYIEAAYQHARQHKWYSAARQVTVNDLYAFDGNKVVHIDLFRDLVDRRFRQPKEGLGNDNSAVAHMWRAMRNPDAPL